MREVYMVNKGEYSDWKVVGVFTTKEKAEKYMEGKPLDHQQEYYGYNEIMAIPLDEEIPPEIFGLCRYCVLMDIHGRVIRITNQEYGQGADVTKPARSINDEKEIYVYCSAKSIEHATKIANDIRAQKIAMGEFG